MIPMRDFPCLKVLRWAALAGVVMSLGGCLGMPEEVRPVQDFDAGRYLGRWYEIARLDHSFERGLVKVTADYSRRPDGGIRVLNRGYNRETGAWDEAEGVARFVRKESEGYLKVSFFGPFYGSYVIFGLDRRNYSYAFVSGFNHDYLWLLARDPQVPESVREAFLQESLERGFSTEEIIWVEQEAGPS